MIGIRKCLDWVFTQRELKILDDTLPEFSRRKQEEDRMRQEEEDAKSICLATDGVSYKLILQNIKLPSKNVIKTILNSL